VSLSAIGDNPPSRANAGGIMRSLLRCLTAIVLVLPLAARAQVIPPLVRDYMAIQGLTAYELATLPPKEIVAAAFGTEYGRALVAELGAILADSAEKACQQSKTLAPADFAERAGEIYRRHGTRMVAASRAFLNVVAYEAALKAWAPSLHADLVKLRGDPDVQKLIALEQPTQFSGIADLVVENFRRYLIIRRIKLSKDVSGLERGDTSLSDRYLREEDLEARYQFVANSRSAQLKRYIELLKTMMEVRTASIDQRLVQLLAPRDYFSGVENDLAELCVPGTKKS
jgi:hypothetical protein